MSTVAERLMTADEFHKLCQDGEPRELVRGKVVELMPANFEHGELALEIGTELKLWIRGRGVEDYAGVESGYVLEEDPDTVRGPDVSYVRAENLPPAEQRRRFVRQCPDLAVEVVSPSNTVGDRRDKTAEYFAAGTSMVWEVLPDRREIVVHTPDGIARTYGPGGVLEGFDLLPGFSCPVAKLFPRN